MLALVLVSNWIAIESIFGGYTLDLFCAWAGFSASYARVRAFTGVVWYKVGFSGYKIAIWGGLL